MIRPRVRGTVGWISCCESRRYIDALLSISRRKMVRTARSLRQKRAEDGLDEWLGSRIFSIGMPRYQRIVFDRVYRCRLGLFACQGALLIRIAAGRCFCTIREQRFGRFRHVRRGSDCTGTKPVFPRHPAGRAENAEQDWPLACSGQPAQELASPCPPGFFSSSGDRLSCAAQPGNSIPKIPLQPLVWIVAQGVQQREAILPIINHVTSELSGGG